MELFVATYKSKYFEECLDLYINKKTQEILEIKDSDPNVDSWYCVVCNRPNCNVIICDTCGYSKYKDIMDAVSIFNKYEIGVESFPLMCLINPLYLKYYTIKQLRVIAELSGFDVVNLDNNEIGLRIIERNRTLFWKCQM